MTSEGGRSAMRYIAQMTWGLYQELVAAGFDSRDAFSMAREALLAMLETLVSTAAERESNQ